jgi:NADP-dependent 3-hydroxy acid dehydrogenase YdfG
MSTSLVRVLHADGPDARRQMKLQLYSWLLGQWEIKTDVTVESDVEAPIQTAIEKYGQVDLAFNNAGVGETSHDLTHTKSADDYHRIMNANVLGVFLSLKR